MGLYLELLELVYRLLLLHLVEVEVRMQEHILMQVQEEVQVLVYILMQVQVLV